MNRVIRSAFSVIVVLSLILLATSCSSKQNASNNGANNSTSGFSASSNDANSSASKVAVAKSFAQGVVNNQYDAISGNCDDLMKSQLSRTRFDDILKSLHLKVGNVVSVSSPILRKIQGYDVAYVPYQFQRGALDVKIVFDPQGKIGGLYFVNHGEL